MNKWGALLMLFVWALMVTGCNSPSESLAETVLEKQAGEDVDINLGAKGAIPSDFPSELPLPKWKPTTTIKFQNSWQLTYTVNDKQEVAKFAEWFEDNGYTTIGTSEYEEMQQWIYDSDRYMVMLALVIDSEGNIFSYTVNAKL